MTGYIGSAAACSYLGIHPNTLARMCKSGRLKFGKIGNQFRFKTEWLDQAVMGRTHA